MSEDRIEKLWGHLGNMSPDQIREHIRKTRSDRKIRKAPKATAKKEVKTKEKSKEKAKISLKGLSPEALERIMKDLGGE